MTTDLVPFSIDQLPVISEERFNALDAAVQGLTNFLPRIQLVTKGKYVDTGKISPGHWGVPVGDEISDLGVSIDVLPLTCRQKALDVADRENIITVYDPSSDEFKRIKAAPKNTGCMWGLSFLVLERKSEKLYELFFGNASGRAESPKLKAFLPHKGSPAQPVTLGIKYKTAKDYGWHVPVVTKCSEPIKGGPDMATTVKEIVKFVNPATGPEVVNEKDDAPKKRAR